MKNRQCGISNGRFGNDVNFVCVITQEWILEIAQRPRLFLINTEIYNLKQDIYVGMCVFMNFSFGVDIVGGQMYACSGCLQQSRNFIFHNIQAAKTLHKTQKFHEAPLPLLSPI